MLSDVQTFARAVAHELFQELQKHSELRPQWLTAAEAAHYLKLTSRALEKMRGTGRGPRFFKAGRLVHYRLQDLDLWLEGGGE